MVGNLGGGLEALGLDEDDLCLLPAAQCDLVTPRNGRTGGAS